MHDLPRLISIVATQFERHQEILPEPSDPVGRGVPQKQDQAKKDLAALRADPALKKWIEDVKSFCKSAAIEKMVIEFALVIAITVVTAGVGDLVAAGAAGWESAHVSIVAAIRPARKFPPRNSAR